MRDRSLDNRILMVPPVRVGARMHRMLAVWLLVILSTASISIQAREYVVAFAQDAADNEWRVAQARMLRDAFSKLPNVRFEVSQGGGSSAKQIVDIEAFVQRKVDLLIVSPRDATLLAPPVARAHRAGIPVILVTRRVDGSEFTTHIGPDDAEIGRAAAQLIVQRLNGKGRVVMLQGNPATSTSKARTQGFVEELSRHKGVRLVENRVANYQRSEAAREIEDILRRKTPFDAVYAQNDTMASGARLAMKVGGRDPGSVVLVGIDYLPEAREAILSGEQSASFIYPLSVMETVSAAKSILAGEKVPHRIVVPSTLVDRSSAERIKTAF